MRFRLIFITLILLAMGPVASADPAALLAKIKAVGKEGEGNPAAAKAWQELVKLGPDALVPILAGLDQADPAAANWLRSAIETIAERELTAKRKLPVDKIETFVKETQHSGAGRRLAYEWLTRVDATASERLLPGMLNDPGSELRRDAVAVVIRDAEQALQKEDKTAATATFEKAFAAARDRDQVDKIAAELKKLGVTVEIPAHFGIIQRWLVVAPFDSTGSVGFGIAYPPEKHVDLNAVYAGKNAAQIGWKEFTSTDPYGLVDLNKVIGKNMGVVAYGFAAVESPREMPVEVRATSNNAVKLFLNGKEVFFREEYHHGMRFDQHTGRGTLKMGRNEILIKVCQNEQTDQWAQSWSFQLRLCDAIGGALPVKVLPEKPTPAKD